MALTFRLVNNVVSGSYWQGSPKLQCSSTVGDHGDPERKHIQVRQERPPLYMALQLLGFIALWEMALPVISCQ